MAHIPLKTDDRFIQEEIKLIGSERDKKMSLVEVTLNDKLIKKLSSDERYQLWRFLIRSSLPSQIEALNRTIGSLLFWEGPTEAHAICNCQPKDKDKK
jgi:hypothetical protein